MAQGVKLADVGVTVGQVFLEKYRVDAIIGQGGMGVVTQCTHLALNERVAIKMLRPDVLLDHDAVERFQREARAAAKLKSEYVARVSDVGQFEGGVPYMVMEFLEGLDLGDLIEQRGVLPVPWAVELMLQTAEALAEAHSHSIVHRDVKPSNLFVTWRPDGSALIKVLDFGISKSPMGTDMQLTQTQSLLGTPAYMSPEQMRSARLVDSRTDIWSLGTVMYEVLEGRKPFEADSFSEMCVKVAVDPPMPMVNTPPALQGVLLRCLAKAPEQRYANMAEFGRDLIPFAPDPHQATTLVERMTRMLRRAAASDFSGDTSAGGRTPANVRDMRSAPMRVATPQPWGPPNQDWQSQPRIPSYQPPARADTSQPLTAPPSEMTLLARPAPRRWLLLGGLIVALALGTTLAFVYSSVDNNEQTANVQRAPTTPSATSSSTAASPTPPAASPTPPAANPTPPAANPGPTTAPAAASSTPTTDTGSGSSSVFEAFSQPKKPIATPKPTKITKPPVATSSKKLEDMKTVAPPPAEPPKSDCDVFDSFSGSGCTKKQ